MRIALITDGIWPYVLGGMQKHSYYLCKYLAKNKVHVDLVHFNRSQYDIQKLEFFTEEEKQYIKSIIVDFPAPGKWPGHYIRASYLHSRLIFEAIKNQLQSYDFIYTKGFTGWHLIEQKKKGKIKCAKIGVNFHGYEMFQHPPDLKSRLTQILFLRYPVKQITLDADVVFSYGGKITDIVKSLSIANSKIFEMPSGVESSIVANDIQPVKDKLKFLFLGRYERRKGIEELNTALNNLRNREFEFHFIGPIPEEKKISLNNVTYHGEIRDKAQLNGLIRNCDVLVCPSWSEGMPNVILEAMANGLAILATDTGATRVLVNENTGWLIQGQPLPENIQNKIEEVLSSNKNEIELKKQNALNHLKNNFIWEKLIKYFLSKLNISIGN